jgi:RNA polymerase sigma-70 factor, ECF subfamily
VSALVPSNDDTGQRADATASGHTRFDDRAFEDLYRESVADVHGYAISLLGSRAAAEDVTALAFERLYRARTRLDRGHGTPRAWLFTIARNAALDELRRRSRQPQRDLLEEMHDGGDAGEDAFEQLARRAMVRDALAALPLREREVVLLKFHGQLSNSELAKALGVSESNAGTRLHRALTRLREQCNQLDDREEVA